MPIWDRDKIIAALLDRKARGLELNTGALQKSDRSLSDAVYRHFGSHDAALAAAGIDPASARQRIAWDRERVVEALRARRDAGLGLSAQAILREDVPLLGGINRYFPSRIAALRAAGIDPASTLEKRGTWDKTAIVAALRERQARGLDLAAAAIRKSRSGISLYRSTKYFFGSYDAALRAADIDPASVHRLQHWDAHRIVQALRRRRAEGQALNLAAVDESDNSLSQAIRRYFDSHDAALRAAGIDPASVRLSTPWDKTRIVAALRDRMDKGFEMNSKAVAEWAPGLHDATLRLFRSHDEALRAAGIDPASVRKRLPIPDDETIFAALRAIAKDESVSHQMVMLANKRLVHVARRRFGSFPAAVRAAGLNYFRERGGPVGSRRPGHWTEQTVLKTLSDLHKDGHDLRFRPMKVKNQPLFFAAKELFGSYVNAVREAGIDYWQMSQEQLAKERAVVASE